MKWFVLVMLVSACGAQRVKVDPVKVEPIHITVDVKVHDAKSAP